MKKSQGTAIVFSLLVSAFTLWSVHVGFPSAAFPHNTNRQTSIEIPYQIAETRSPSPADVDDPDFPSNVSENSARSAKLEISAEPLRDKSPHYGPAVRLSKESESECDGRRVYMHELPPEFNTLLLDQCEEYAWWVSFCPQRVNWGFGERTHRRSKSWYRTDLHLAEVIFHRRMTQYPCLTDSPHRADLYYIPYYSGLDALRFLYGSDINSSSEHGVELVAWMQENAPQIWGKNDGGDHFLVMARPAWDFSRPLSRTEGWGTSLLELPALQNVISLVPETRTWPWQEQAIPYPTSFHPSTPANLDMWLNRIRRSRRTFLMAFAGGGGLGSSPNIRHSIRVECEDVPADCAIVDCEGGKCDHDPGYLMRTMMRSHFCLQPPGDTPTRRSTFDGIIAGCIPVFFENQGAYTQYTWHLPSDPKLYSVLIPKDDVVFGDLKIRQVLGRYSAEEVSRLRENVINLIPRVIYTNPQSSRDAVTKDAFDIAIDGVVEKVSRMRAQRQFLQQKSL